MFSTPQLLSKDVRNLYATYAQAETHVNLDLPSLSTLLRDDGTGSGRTMPVGADQVVEPNLVHLTANSSICMEDTDLRAYAYCKVASPSFYLIQSSFEQLH